MRFNTQPPEGGWLFSQLVLQILHGFNTQPPEGGWLFSQLVLQILHGFNTQPPEGGWSQAMTASLPYDHVSTHSRLKAAGESR